MVAEEENCLFCRYAHGDIDDPHRILYHDGYVTAFEEKYPLALCHILLVPNVHIPSLAEIDNTNSVYIQHIHLTAVRLAEQLQLSSYTLFARSGAPAGQTKKHLHYHMVSNKEHTCFVSVVQKGDSYGKKHN